MPTLKVKGVSTASVEGETRRTCVVYSFLITLLETPSLTIYSTFCWDEIPERSRPSYIWCLRCCIDKLEGKLNGPCLRTRVEAYRCYNCLHQFKQCVEM